MGGIVMATTTAKFKPFDIQGTPMDNQIMNWNRMIKPPYDKNSVDAYTRTRVILMNGIENNSVLTSHCMSRMIDNDEINRQLAMIRRADSQQQQTVNWLNPANQSIVETTRAYEQVAVDLTADLAQNEPDDYFRQVLDFALLEDFDHLFRYGCLMELLEGKDPNNITQGKTDIKPGRATVFEHRHPYDEMRKHYNKDKASTKTKLNYLTIVSAEQQTMLFYKSHGFMYANDLARKLYAEIAEIEEQHVTQYEMGGDPRETPLEKMTLIQLNEAYNYYSCAQTESDERIKRVWEQFCQDEIEHFFICNGLMQQFEGRDIRDILKTDTIEPLIVFHPNKEYVDTVLDTQEDLQPLNMEFVSFRDLPSDWSSWAYRDKVNSDGVPSEIVVERAKSEAMVPQAI
jgi:rubrerythrin